MFSLPDDGLEITTTGSEDNQRPLIRCGTVSIPGVQTTTVTLFADLDGDGVPKEKSDVRQQTQMVIGRSHQIRFAFGQCCTCAGSCCSEVAGLKQAFSAQNLGARMLKVSY